MDEELGRERCQRADSETASPNYRNGYSQKTVKTQLGEIDIKVPRDRKGNYAPKIITKYDRSAEGMEDKILSLYACGMSQRDIAEQIKSLYDVEISPELVSKISEKIMPEVTAWQNRPLEAVYSSYRKLYRIKKHAQRNSRNDEEWENNHFTYRLGPAIIPGKTVRTGKIYPSGRVWAMLDTLLTSDTISEARDISYRR